jgi:two-component sensor histidine kinase
MRGEHTDHEEFLYRLPNGAELILSISARPVLDAENKVLGAVQISLDITERKRAETQRRLLTKELDHRVKNNLAIVQALVQQTLRNSESLEQAGAVLSGRLAALAQAQEMLTQAEWLESGLRKTIETTLLAQTTSDRVTLDGPDLALPPSQVMAMTLVVHELTTNALKYGALSNETGTVKVSWKVDEKDELQLIIRWVELSGPPVAKPTRRGFGSRLLERIIGSEGGEVERSFDPDGFACVLRLPYVGSQQINER